VDDQERPRFWTGDDHRLADAREYPDAPPSTFLKEGYLGGDDASHNVSHVGQVRALVP